MRNQCATFQTERGCVRRTSGLRCVLGATILLVLLAFSSFSADKKVIFIAGKPSHGPGEHEHRAGSLLLKSCLDNVAGISTSIYSNGWPSDPAALQDASTIVLYMDGGEGHPALAHLDQLGGLMKKGVGLVCIHYATEPTPEKGEKEWLKWIGGAFEPNWSVNPHWDANFNRLPHHPITSGVKPFQINDEWYFHIRLADRAAGVMPILMAVPPESAMSRPDGPHEGNAAAREAVHRKQPQTVAWAINRADGGRGFGFTGAHLHKNWGNENFRKIVLNAIVWTAGMEVPKDGVSCSVSGEDLQKNLDQKGK